MIVLGIDPGISGGWAIIDGNEVACGDLPTRPHTLRKKATCASLA